MNGSREEELFALALEQPTGRRGAFLESVCANDPALRRRVEALLVAHEHPDLRLVEPSPSLLHEWKLHPPTNELGERPHEAVGQTIGRYKLLEKIGEGGCGVVYVADQTEPVRRRVALKVIKLGMDTAAVVARFEAERQALAMMDHPNIARVFDAGTTEQGRPFFVMELVRGIRITDYCDQAQLSTTERLELFMKVCQAIQHAHQKGIIHRDIKPSNILVTLHDGVPVPKVIDFGIAKATEGRLTDATVYTQLHEFMGTPAYMSPEQAEMSGLDIDTRSDIYSLGVLLYELLAGSTPFDGRELMASGIDAMRKTIREKEPARPSTKLATLQGDALTTTVKSRSSDVARLQHEVRGDLDWIVMKCLEKDRNRRYDTANGLAADLKRHLSNEPVVAAAPSTSYRFGKYVQRNKRALSVAAALGIILIAGTIASTWQAVRATRAEAQVKRRIIEVAGERDAKERARQVAETAQQEAEAITTFLADVFQSPDPSRDGRNITVAESLDRAAGKLETNLLTQPSRRANLQAAVGKTYSSLGLFPEAIPLVEKSRNYFLTTLGPEHPDTLRVIGILARAYDQSGRRNDALQLREKLLASYRKICGPEHPETLTAMDFLAVSYAYCQREAEAIQLHGEVVALSRKIKGPEHPDTLTAMHGLGTAHLIAITANKHPSPTAREEATRLMEQVYALRLQTQGPEHRDTLQSKLSVSWCYTYYANRREEALVLREEVVAVRRKVLGPTHMDTVRAMSNLADSYGSAKRVDDIVKLREQMLADQRTAQGHGHPETLMAMNNLAGAYQRAGRPEDARKIREEAVQSRRQFFGIDGLAHPQRAANTESNLIDLSRYYNAFLADEWQGGSGQGNDLLELPVGRQKFAGVTWDIRGIIQLSSKRMAKAEPAYPEKVEGISIAQPGRRLHFLHSAGYATGLTNQDPTIGRYLIHFADGHVETLPIVLGKDVLDWWVKPAAGALEPVVAWSGSNLLSRVQRKAIRVFKTTWENPRPAVEITSLDVISEMKEAAPFLIAITVDSSDGLRPADAPPISSGIDR